MYYFKRVINLFKVQEMIVRFSILLSLCTSSYLYSSDGENLKTSQNINPNSLMLYTKHPSELVVSTDSKFSLKTNNALYSKLSSTKNISFSSSKKGKTKLGKWVTEHTWEVFYLGLALGTGITAGILNSSAKRLDKEEAELYNKYITAPKNSDFNKLWNDYESANDKTKRLVRVRNIFTVTSGGICIALFMSFSLNN